jgi:hypothetical protein
VFLLEQPQPLLQFAILDMLSAAPLGTTHQMSPKHAADPVDNDVGGLTVRHRPAGQTSIV